MSLPLRVLIVEDSENDAELVLRELRRGGYEPTYERVETPQDMGAALERQTWDIILSDYSMPHFSGPAALETLRAKAIDLPFIIISGTIGEETAVSAMRAGAHDYIMKNNLIRLIPAIDREIKEAKLREERRKAEEMINYLAYHDSLTRLPNRTMLRDRLLELILTSRLKNSSFALLIMNLSRFKEINNTLGYQNGDIILQKAKERLQDNIREADMIARIEGDKFALLIPDTDADGAARAAGKIIKILEEPFVLEELPLDVSASIGIALYPGHGEDADTLLRRGDIAMHTAKKIESGFCIYSPQHDQYSPDRLSLIAELRKAIEEDQLFLLYQPKIELKTGRISGVEALVRWQHPKLGVIPPDKFISLAERSGLIKQLTFWVLKEALRQSRSWYQRGLEISVAVNLSVRNLQAPQLLDQIKGLLSTWGVMSGSLRLEITESIIMADPAHAMEILEHLTSIGIRFSVDDFGTGYSSLGYLKRLPVDELKIDKSFVINMMANENDAIIVHSVIDLAHNLGLKVTAEGVESKEIMDKLITLGCDAAQGYFISRPVKDIDLTNWLERSNPNHS